jgi:hypothetical protein
VNEGHAAKAAPRRRYRLFARVLAPVLLACAAPSALWLYPQPTPVEARDLIIDPTQAAELRGFAWRLSNEEGPDGNRATWTTGQKGQGQPTSTYGQEVAKYRNKLVSRWHYRSTQRSNYEDDQAGITITAVGSLNLLADEFDIYCVDVNGVFRVDPSRCAVWVFGARYGQFRVYINLDNAGVKLDDTRFQNVVKSIDQTISKKLISGE